VSARYNSLFEQLEKQLVKEMHERIDQQLSMTTMSWPRTGVPILDLESEVDVVLSEFECKECGDEVGTNPDNCEECLEACL
jgi:hypothetical protein